MGPAEASLEACLGIQHPPTHTRTQATKAKRHQGRMLSNHSARASDQLFRPNDSMVCTHLQNPCLLPARDRSIGSIRSLAQVHTSFFFFKARKEYKCPPPRLQLQLPARFHARSRFNQTPVHPITWLAPLVKKCTGWPRPRDFLPSVTSCVLADFAPRSLPGRSKLS